MLQIHFKISAILLTTMLLPSLSIDSAYAESEDNGKIVNVKVLSIKGCQATPPTIELVESVAIEMNINIHLNVTIVETPEQAQKNHFIGSPTVQINGIDIEPALRKIELFGVT